MDLAKLTRDCRLAFAAAQVAADSTDDGGTANLDSTFLRLKKHVRAAPILAAIEASGLSANPGKWIGRGIFIDAPVKGQGNKRSAANEALSSSLKEAGWNVLPYYQMD